jgi:hypothetical protein
MKSLKYFFWVFVLISISVSCSKKGSEFLGKWKHASNQIEVIEIISNGDNYIMKASGKEIPATFNNGNLEIKTNQLGMETITITYVEKDDKIIVNGFNGPQELIRAKD